MSRADVMAGKAYVSLYVKNDKFTRGLQAAKTELNKFGSDMMSIGAQMAGIGAALIAPLAASVKLASDFEESFSKFGIVFGAAAVSVKQWSDEFAASVGRSKLQIVQFMASTQDLFVPIGFDPVAAENMSKQITALAVDLASFNNMQDADTLRDLQAALTGSGEVMKKYGVLVSEAAVKQELLNQGMDPTKATEMQKVQARLSIIMRGTTAAQGDAIRTAGSFANQVKALQSELTNIAVEIGSALLPSLSQLAKSMASIIKHLITVAKANPEVVVSFAAMAGAIAAAGTAMISLGIASKVAAAGLGVLISGVGLIKTVISTGVAAFTLFKMATIAVSAFLQSTFTASVVASTGAVTALTAAQAAQVIVIQPYIAATVIAANATAFLGMNAVATTASIISQSGAMGLLTAASGVASTGLITTSGAMAAAGTGAIILGTSAKAASTGMITLAGSSAVASSGVATVSASAGVMATAWASASAVIGSAWAIILGPITPLSVLIGGVIAAVSALAVSAAHLALRGLDFSAAWKVATTTLYELMVVAKKVGGVLMEALGGGDYDIAMAAVFAGIKLALATAIDGMVELWNLFWSGAWSLAKSFFMNFLGLTQKVVAAIANAIKNPLQAARDIKNALADVMSGKISIAPDTTGMRAAANAELDRLEKELDARKAKREAEAKSKEAGAAGGAGAAGEGAAAGNMNAEQVADGEQSEKAADAFDRETESLRQQIIALRQGEEAAERFRLEKQGLSDAQINQVMSLRAEEDALHKQQEASQRSVRMIQEFADADYKKNKLTPEEIANKEKKSIEAARQKGQIDEQTAKQAIAQADIRRAEREHQERLKQFEGNGAKGKVETAASAATFSAASLVAMGNTTSGNGQLKAALDTKKAIDDQTKQQKELHEQQVAAIKILGLHHA